MLTSLVVLPSVMVTSCVLVAETLLDLSLSREHSDGKVHYNMAQQHDPTLCLL